MLLQSGPNRRKRQTKWMMRTKRGNQVELIKVGTLNSDVMGTEFNGGLNSGPNVGYCCSQFAVWQWPQAPSSFKCVVHNIKPWLHLSWLDVGKSKHALQCFCSCWLLTAYLCFFRRTSRLFSLAPMYICLIVSATRISQSTLFLYYVDIWKHPIKRVVFKATFLFVCFLCCTMVHHNSYCTLHFMQALENKLLTTR